MYNNNASVELTTAIYIATSTVKDIIIGVSVEIKVFVASLGNNRTWKELKPETKVNYNFIKDSEDTVLGLAGKVGAIRQG